MNDRNAKDSILLNFDGYRETGPSGGSNHRLQDVNSPDT